MLLVSQCNRHNYIPFGSGVWASAVHGYLIVGEEAILEKKLDGTPQPYGMNDQSVSRR